MIPLSIPNFEGNEQKYVDEALAQGWVSTGGAFITKLENKLAEFLHTPRVAACQSGTSAIHMSLVECGVVPGDMVIVPALTFIAAVILGLLGFIEPVQVFIASIPSCVFAGGVAVRKSFGLHGKCGSKDGNVLGNKKRLRNKNGQREIDRR